MIDGILDTLKSQVGAELLQKTGISSDKLDPLLKIAGSVVTNEVKNEAQSNGMAHVMNLFSSDKNNSFADSIQNNIANGLIKNFISKLGLSEQQANIATQIILPQILGFITKANSKTPDSDPSPLQDIFDMFGDKKGKSGDLGGLKNVLGNIFKK